MKPHTVSQLHRHLLSSNRDESVESGISRFLKSPPNGVKWIKPAARLATNEINTHNTQQDGASRGE